MFWTGGWDSTFQLLRVLLVQKRSLIPYYLIDVDRLSTGLELKAMRRIKNEILRLYPQCQELFQPTRYFAVADIPPDAEISDAFRAIRKEFPLGTQYEWLAWFCKAHGITGIQLCLEKSSLIPKPGGPPHSYTYIHALTTEFEDGGQSSFRIADHFKGRDQFTVLGHYSYPVFGLTKRDMAARAEEQGWTKILTMTWFCHWPTRKMKPCGRCNPCLATIHDGMGWRVPLMGRILSRFSKGY